MQKLPPLLLLWLCLSLLQAQDYQAHYRSYSVADGLPNPSVCQSLQDKNGFIWVATFNGVARLDGTGIKTYYPYVLDSLARARDCPILYESSEGQLWLGYGQAPQRLFRYDACRDTFLAFAGNSAPAFETSGVQALWEESGRKLWVATSNDGLLAFDLTDQADTLPYRHYRHDPEDAGSLPIDYMGRGLWRSPEGDLWLLTEAGLTCLPSGQTQFVNYTWSDIASENEGLGFLPDTSRNCFWIGTFAGLVRFDWERKTHERFSVFSEKNGKDPLPVWKPVMDHNGVIWVVTGVYPNAQAQVFYPATAQFGLAVTEQSGKRAVLPGANNLGMDRNGNIWSGGYSRGLQSIQPGRRNVYRRLLSQKKVVDRKGQPFDDGGIKAMVEDAEGTLWVGTDQQGLWRWNAAEENLVQVDLTSLDQPITHLSLSDDQSQLWVSTPYYLMRIALPSMVAQRVDPYPSQAEYARFLTAMPWKGKLLGSCFQQGLYLANLDGSGPIESFLPQTPNSTETWGDLPVSNINCIATGGLPGHLWFGTTFQGFFGWDEGSRKLTHHLPQIGIQQIFPTSNGLLWLAGTKGLEIYDPKAKQVVTTPQLPEEGLRFIMGMAMDAQGLMWVAGERGILAIDTARLEVVHQFEASGWLEGDQEWYTRSINCLAASHGELLFASPNGLFALRPEAITYDSLAPQVYLDEFSIDKTKQPLPAGPAAAIRLNYRQNNLSFRVAVLHYELPENNQLAYQLVNFDQDWRFTKPGQMIEYPKLPPGDYALRVYGINSDGYRSEAETLTEFRIARPWYANNIAYAVYLALCLAAIYGVFRLLLWRRAKAAEQQYWQELDRAKSTLFTNISHEFRTPLTLILGEASAIQKEVSGHIRQQSERIARNGQRLLWLVNQLLELAKADSGFLKLKLQQADVVAFLRQQLQAFHSLAEQHDIQLTFSSAEPSRIMDFDPQLLQQVVSNLVHNAIKFSEAQGEVSMRVGLQTHGNQDYLSFQVQDDGVGIAEKELPRIFDRFYHISQPQGGTGIGLALTKELVELMEGKISVASRVGQGAAFSVVLPIRNEAPLGTGDWEAMPHLSAWTAQASVQDVKPAEQALPQLLIIEDNEDLRAFLNVCLSETFNITLARDGQDGLDLAFDQKFDLIISDVMMPRLDGYTVCETLKAELSTSHIPVILLTARVDADSRMEGLARGADVYLGKPFDPNELRLRCQQLLQQQQRLKVYYLSMIRSGRLSESNLSQTEQEEMAFITEARSIVLARLGEEGFGVSELANELNMSRSNLHRKLQQMVEMSTSRFISSVRVQQAEQLLCDPSLSVAEVAYAVGFSDPDYFSRVFREINGLSPTAFRRQLPQNGNE